MNLTNESLVLVVNPGSASRKYALYAGENVKATINFEFVDGAVMAKVEHDGQVNKVNYDDPDLSDVSKYVSSILTDNNILKDQEKIDAIGIRIVAPSNRFMRDELLTAEVELALEAVQQKAPLHVTTALAEIKHLKSHFGETPIITISDSAFHATKPQWARSYGIDTELAEKSEIMRYGFHGISVGSVVRKMKQADILAPKMVVCHLGSGSSLSAVVDGKSIENTMGYTPLEGLMMATRTGNIDVSAALAIKRALELNDEELESYLNKKSGLLGVSGSSNDIRQLLASEEQGDERAALALKLFVYRIQQSIGQMVASMGGIDVLVFTATIGERSAPIRGRVMEGLEYLGLIGDKALNEETFEPKEATNIGTSESKPIIVISTDESQEIASRVNKYLSSN
jgi:acetate kinase